MVRKTFKIDSWFYTPTLRALQSTGRVSYMPNCLRYAARKRNAHRKADIFIGSACLPEPDGKIRFALGNVYEEEIAKAASIVILEVNPNAPRSFGDNYLESHDVDFIIETDYQLPTIEEAPVTELDMQIGRRIAGLIGDGACIQVGIGAIPSAVCMELERKKDIGIHTEMMTTGLMRLMKSGAATGRRKQADTGKAVCAFAIGTRELYEFLDSNPDILVRRGCEVNDPSVIMRNDNQVSINSTVEIDLGGQCSSESIGTMQISGAGGQSDTAIGAQQSRNGFSVIGLHSTAMASNPKTGLRERVSKIVPILRPGAAVTLSRNDADYIATEYGCVSLRGLTIKERAESLISIAHPEYREELRKAASELQLWI
jgi:acyl-CoA hydrolase